MKKILFTPLLISMMLIFVSIADAGITDCKPGYKFNRNSGVGCQQINCNDIPDAHYSYTGQCICGSSGSINEKTTDPNKKCSYPLDHSSCPGCVYACVGLQETCPGESNDTDIPELNNPPPTQIESLSSGQANQPTQNTNIPPPPIGSPQPPTQNTLNAQPTSTNLSTAGIIPDPAQASANAGMTCQKFCARLTRGNQYDDVLKAEGTYPLCNCVIDNKDDSNRLAETITINGDKRTTYIYDPTTGALIKKNIISISAERERIRQSLGYKYDEEQINAMLDDAIIEKWFQMSMQNIETKANITHAQFWWQHIVALWDHGYGNSADFVDTYNFGRCGDSMMWLERNLSKDLKLTGKKDKTSEAMLSITGEKYGNLLNHTALIIRPTGYSNTEWSDAVQELMDKTREGGLSKSDINNIDPRLLDAKVLDPYFKKSMTVRDFIKGWSVIKIS
ncbi:MAG: hypothetical protein P1P90_00055 [Patescibacteria group bacterium]|nr:hypothetical protein [Patescibacteria group bacterium]